MKHIINEPFTKEKLAELKVGDTVLLTGTIYCARDAAHKRLVEMLKEGKDLPMDTVNAGIYYAGPTPAKPGYPSGSAGPTTSYRMDSFAPALMEQGVSVMIGKGPRNQEVNKAIEDTGSVYFAAVGGAAALIAQCIRSSEVIAFEDLGTEAIRKLYVEEMPLVVAHDCHGGDIYNK